MKVRAYRLWHFPGYNGICRDPYPPLVDPRPEFPDDPFLFELPETLQYIRTADVETLSQFLKWFADEREPVFQFLQQGTVSQIHGHPPPHPGNRRISRRSYNAGGWAG